MILRTYQEEISDQAAEILKQYKLVYLAMEVRTGKTLSALETARKYGATKILFITKIKAMPSIRSDADNFPTLQVDILNYESVHKYKGKVDLVICDEAHSLGTFPKPTNRNIAVKKIAKGLPIIFLSGTPSPESYSQLYHTLSVSSFSVWSDYTNFYKWAKVYVIKKTMFVFNRQLNDYKTARKELIETDIKPILLTFTQAQAGFEVTINEKVLTVPMPLSMPYIDTLRKDRIIETKNGNVVLADTAVKLMNKIQQLCSGTIITEDKQAFIIDKSKALYIQKYFAGQKIAVFYKYKAEFELLSKVLTNYTTSPETFQESKDKVFLGQFVSSREGIRLDTAEALVFYNIDYSYLSYEQAKNRIISKERTAPATLYWIFAINGIEEKIYKAVRNKQNYTSSYFARDYGKVRS